MNSLHTIIMYFGPKTSLKDLYTSRSLISDLISNKLTAEATPITSKPSSNIGNLQHWRDKKLDQMTELDILSIPAEVLLKKMFQHDGGKKDDAGNNDDDKKDGGNNDDDKKDAGNNEDDKKDGVNNEDDESISSYNDDDESISDHNDDGNKNSLQMLNEMKNLFVKM